MMIIARIIGQLEAIKQRPQMYIGDLLPSRAETFFNGFSNGLAVLGIELPLRCQMEATEAHGWQWDAGSTARHMKAAGLADSAIVDELISITIDAWRLVGPDEYIVDRSKWENVHDFLERVKKPPS